MRYLMQAAVSLLMFALPVLPGFAAPEKAEQKEAVKYQETLEAFRNSGVDSLIDTAYGYAIFPTIGKAGFGLGGAHGSGRVYQRKNYVGDSKMTQVTLGFQLGGQAYSQLILFEDKRAFNEFTSGNFEFGGQATAVALTAGASAEAGTKGSAAGASGGQNDAVTAGGYYKGMAVFTIAKGGLMFEASIGGQKFSYEEL